MEHKTEEIFRDLQRILDTHESFEKANKDTLMDILLDEDIPEMAVTPLQNELMDVFEQIYPDDLGILLTMAHERNPIIYKFLVEITGSLVYCHSPEAFRNFFKQT